MPTFETNTIWFDVAVMATLIALGHCLLGHFEEQTPKWRKVLKLFVALGVSVLISAFLGRGWFWGLLGFFGIAVVIIHAWWLPRQGINGWTAEPRDKYYKLRGWRDPCDRAVTSFQDAQPTPSHSPPKGR